jgi:hypothetical protein
MCGREPIEPDDGFAIPETMLGPVYIDDSDDPDQLKRVVMKPVREEDDEAW